MKNKIYLITLSPATHRTSEENLGILYLKSSLVKSDFEVEIIDGWLNEYDIETVFNKIKYDDDLLFVGISSYMSNTLPSINLIKMLKEHYPDIKIVCGGFGPTFYPEEHLRSGADFVSRGEGEISLVKLACSLRDNTNYKNIKGISYLEDNKLVNNECQDLVEDLDSLPFPSRDTIDVVLKNKSTVNMLTSRGCSGNCEFCSVISFFRLSNGKIWRTRSIKNIVDEIEILSNRGVELIKMVDDSFVDGIRDSNWCYEFANEINKRNIKVKLRGQIRADKVTDEILLYLKNAGFYSFACGIENEKAFCIEGNDNAKYTDNVNILNGIFNNCSETSTDQGDNGFFCMSNSRFGPSAFVSSNGSVTVFSEYDSGIVDNSWHNSYCGVATDNSFGCEYIEHQCIGHDIDGTPCP